MRTISSYLPERAHGRTQSWKKWSFPTPTVHEIDATSPGWVRVAKRRRIGWFSVVDGVAAARGSESLIGQYAVELTEVFKRTETWWTLGIEAAAPPPPDTLSGTLEATAARLFSSPIPDGVRLRRAESMSYSEWLRLHDQGHP